MRLIHCLFFIYVSFHTLAAEVFRDQIEVQWLADGNRGWYRVVTAADSAEYVLFDAETGKKQPLFDAAAAQQAMGLDAAKATVLGVSDDCQTVSFRAGDKYWQKRPDGQFQASTPEELQKNQGRLPPIVPSEIGGGGDGD